MNFKAALRNGLHDSPLHDSMARALRRLGRNDDAGARMELFHARKQAEAAAGGQS